MMKFFLRLISELLIFSVLSAMCLFYTQDIVNYVYLRIEGQPIESIVIGKSDNRHEDVKDRIWKVTVSIHEKNKKNIFAHDFDINAKAYNKIAVGQTLTVLMPKQILPLEESKTYFDIIKYIFSGRPTLNDFFLLEAANVPLYFLIFFTLANLTIFINRFRRFKLRKLFN